MKIESSYDEITYLYDVYALYIQNVDIETTLTHYDSISSLMTIILVPGSRKTVFFLSGTFAPIPHSTAGAERFSLFMALNSFNLNDTIYFTFDNITAFFFYEKLYSGLLQNGFATELDGYLVINQINGDTLSGYIKINGEAVGVYFSPISNVHDFHVRSWISGQIEFRANKKTPEGKQKIIAKILVPRQTQIEHKR
ncbi:MAG: hypothetical protein ACPL28_11945 [bacterium]